VAKGVGYHPRPAPRSRIPFAVVPERSSVAHCAADGAVQWVVIRVVPETGPMRTVSRFDTIVVTEERTNRGDWLTHLAVCAAEIPNDGAACRMAGRLSVT
jgi:hypothetical protein